MNTKFTKVVPVLLAVAAVLAISTFQVFAHNPSENEGLSHRSSATQSAVVDDHGVDAVGTHAGEDMTFSGTVEAISADSITIGGKVIALAAGSKLDSGVMVGSMVKVEVIQQADGTLLAKEVESETETEIEHLNGDDHGNGTEMGDDHGTDAGKIDDKGTGSGSSSNSGGTSGSADDHGGNSGSGSSGGVDDHGGNSGKGK
jgi:uncharacterized membrane protein YgcG